MAVTSPAATTTKMPRVTRAVIAASVAGGVVRLRTPLDEPQTVFGAVPEIEGWEQAPSGYTLTVSDPDLAAPALARALVGADADILSIAE
ncbi:MAG TPA: hypothetical protein VE464_01090, partial [Streptosporangiaceae bacterium]|nr:hypothetical protein [Streptosporangiaceae bacterium]